MLELAGSGAQVMQARSMEVAERFGVEIHVRSAFHTLPGTWVVAKEKLMLEKAFVSSLALDKSEVRLTVVGVPDQPGVAAQVLTALAADDIPVDMIIQSAPTSRGVNDISFMTPKSSAPKARKALEGVAKKLRAERVDLNDQVAKISAVGTGFRHSPKIAASMFTALAEHKINIHMISASDLRVSCIVDLDQGEPALKALHKAYGLARGKK
jgi:aspartate kinase